MPSSIDDIDLADLCLEYESELASLKTNNINAEGRELLEKTPADQLTVAVIEQFYTRHHANFCHYPFHTIAMMPADLLNEERLAAIKKYDLQGLAHYHHQLLTPQEFAAGIGYNPVKIEPREYDYHFFLSVIDACLSHHGYDTDANLLKGSLNKRNIHADFCKFMLALKPLENLIPLVKTPAQRRLMVELFGLERVNEHIKLNAKEKRAALSSDLNL